MIMILGGEKSRYSDARADKDSWAWTAKGLDCKSSESRVTATDCLSRFTESPSRPGDGSDSPGDRAPNQPTPVTVRARRQGAPRRGSVTVTRDRRPARPVRRERN